MPNHYNLSTPLLVREALSKGECQLSKDGAIVIDTGEFKGRAANDKFIVMDDLTRDTVDWQANKQISSGNFEILLGKVYAYLQGVSDRYYHKFYAGTNKQLRFHFETTSPTHALFAKTMFYEDDVSAGSEWTLLHVPQFFANPGLDGTRSGTFIIISFSRRIIMIGGTSYAGEIKKSIFTVLNFLLPDQGVLPMHSSVNETKSGNSTVFFGLSGTGKTTLSADSTHILVGDDEHGWDDNGVFNFEDGCYAKVIKLSQEKEPEIWGAVNKFGSVLENVQFVTYASGELDFNYSEKTENTRGAYKLSNIPNASKTRRARHPNNVIMLSCDAYGVLPPVAKLTARQAVYYFLSGYTAKVAGTEAGITEPTATFSACFGAPFLPRRAMEYGEKLYEKVIEHDVNVWLVNTGWTGGGYGVGNRIDLKHTRAIVNSIIDGTLNTSYLVDPHFGFEVPTEVPGVPSDLLNPKRTWKSKTKYEAAARTLVDKFKINFNEKYKIDLDSVLWNAGPM